MMAASPVEERLAALSLQLEAVLRQLHELQKENLALRRQLEAARGFQQHQPYALQATPPSLAPLPGPLPLAPLPTPQFSPVKPLGPSVMAVDADSSLGVREREVGSTPDAKRPSAVRALVVDGPNV